MEKREPKLRFPGFEGEWEDKVFGDMAIKGKRSKLAVSQSSTVGEHPFYNSGVNGYRTDNPIILGDKGSILVNDGGTANFRYVDGTYSYSNHVLQYKVKEEFSTKYIHQYLQYKKENIYRTLFVGTGIKNINQQMMDRYTIRIAKEKEEQERIGDLFYNLDQRIEAQEEMLESLKKVKKALLQCVIGGGA